MATKRNTRNKRHQPDKSIPWRTMLVSFAVGAFVMFLFHLNRIEPTTETSKNTSTATVKKQQKQKAIEPTFDFYTLLPEMEVVVDEPQQSQSKKIVSAPAQHDEQKSASQVDKTRYILQVGSFRKAQDADSFRARLALLGIESKVQTVTIDNKDTWHRVQVGPITGQSNVEQMQRKLKQNSIDALLMRAKHG